MKKSVSADRENAFYSALPNSSGQVDFLEKIYFIYPL